MIRLTRINHAELVVNADLIEHIEITPDTVISMTTGQKFMVRENAQEVIRKVIEFRRAILTTPVEQIAAESGPLESVPGESAQHESVQRDAQ